MRCAGKKGVVTGTSRGLGREILLALCGEGASVVGFARDAEAGGGAVEEANRTEGHAAFVQGDVRREQDIVDAIARCKEEFGGFDFIVNNAGILGEGRLHETSNDLWDDLVATHLTGAFWGCKHALETMRDRRHRGLDREHRLHPLLHRRRLSRRLHGHEVGRPRAHEGDRDRLRARRDPLQLHLPRRHGDADDRAVLRRDGRPRRRARGDGRRPTPARGSRTRARSQWPRSSSSRTSPRS